METAYNNKRPGIEDARTAINNTAKSLLRIVRLPNTVINKSPHFGNRHLLQHLIGWTAERNGEKLVALPC